MIATNCYISWLSNVSMSPDGNLLSMVNVFMDENPGDDLRVGDVISDSGYTEYRVFSISEKFSPQDWNVVVEDVRQVRIGPTSGQGIIFTPTPKWKLARVSTTVMGDQYRAVYDETNREIIDENLGGMREAVQMHTISSDEVTQGFIDITNLSPVPWEAKSCRLNVVTGIEQVNADAPGIVWGITPDFQVQMNTSWKRIVFKNHGQPTVPLSGHLDVDDTVQFVYLYKP